jgi:Cu/Ag efflux protein CusF
MKAPYAMGFLVPDTESLKKLKAGQMIAASVRRQGADYVLDDLRAAPATGPTRKGER